MAETQTTDKNYSKSLESLSDEQVDALPVSEGKKEEIKKRRDSQKTPATEAHTAHSDSSEASKKEEGFFSGLQNWGADILSGAAGVAQSAVDATGIPEVANYVQNQTGDLRSQAMNAITSNITQPPEVPAQTSPAPRPGESQQAFELRQERDAAVGGFMDGLMNFGDQVKKNYNELFNAEEAPAAEVQGASDVSAEIASTANTYGMTPEDIAPAAQQAAAESANPTEFQAKLQEYTAMLQREQEMAKQRMQMQESAIRFQEDLGPEGKIDPNRWLKNTDFGDKMLLGVTLLFFGRDGLGFIQNMINKDIEAQKFQLNDKFRREEANQAATIQTWKQMMKGGGPNGQLLMRKHNLLSSVIASGEKASMNPGITPQQKANLQANMQQLYIERDNVIAQMDQAALDGVNFPDRAFDGSLDETPWLNEEQAKKYVPGFGVAASQFDKEEFQKTRALMEVPLTHTSSIVKIASGNHNRLSITDRQTLETDLAMLAGNLRLDILGPGVMTEDEYKRLRKLIGNPNDFIQDKEWALAKLRKVEARLKMKMDLAIDRHIPHLRKKPKSSGMSTFKPNKKK